MADVFGMVSTFMLQSQDKTHSHLQEMREKDVSLAKVASDPPKQEQAVQHKVMPLQLTVQQQVDEQVAFQVQQMQQQLQLQMQQRLQQMQPQPPSLPAPHHPLMLGGPQLQGAGLTLLT